MNPFTLLSMFGRAPQLQTVTFNSNTTWVAPAGVNLLTSVVGHGVAGAAATTAPRNSLVVSVVYHSSGSAGGGSAQWDSFQGLAEAVAAEIDASDTVNYTLYVADVYPDETNTLSTSAATILNGAGGSSVAVFSSGWRTSGHISTSGTAGVNWSEVIPATTGASATGFGFTFAGGTGGAATTDTHNNVAVTPGNSYPIVVPSGATIQITYYI